MQLAVLTVKKEQSKGHQKRDSGGNTSARSKLHIVNVRQLNVKVQMINSNCLLMLKKSERKKKGRRIWGKCKNGRIALDSFAGKPFLSEKETH